jgi:hypothetical protein
MPAIQIYPTMSRKSSKPFFRFPMTIESILAGKGLPNSWGLTIDPMYDEEGNELPIEKPMVNGTFDPRPYEVKEGDTVVGYKGISLFNVGAGSFMTTYKGREADPYFLGWILASPTNNNLLVII